MQNSSTEEELSFRVGLIERVVADQGRRLGDLTHALFVNNDADRAPPETIVVDADSVSPFAAGFHFRETDGAGRPYRWTGRGDFFELRLKIDRNIEWDFELDLRGNDHVNIATLRVFADYVEIPVSFANPSYHVVGTIPAKAISDLAVLTFYLPIHFVPSKLDPQSADHRTLSAVFYALTLVPRSGSTAAR
ncbi:MAG TPA: hypothetical protein VGK90_11795 [Rhizomicrobium sp.]|jgi:hypothetical protein